MGVMGVMGTMGTIGTMGIMGIMGIMGFVEVSGAKVVNILKKVTGLFGFLCKEQ